MSLTDIKSDPIFWILASRFLAIVLNRCESSWHKAAAKMDMHSTFLINIFPVGVLISNRVISINTERKVKSSQRQNVQEEKELTTTNAPKCLYWIKN